MSKIIRGFDANSVSVQFEGGFSTSMLNAVRAVSGRTYNPQRKIWLIPCEQKSLDLLLENIYQTGLVNIEENRKEVPFSYKNPEENGVEPEPLSHQSNSQELQKLKEILTAKHYSPRTIENYLYWKKNF